MSDDDIVKWAEDVRDDLIRVEKKAAWVQTHYYEFVVWAEQRQEDLRRQLDYTNDQHVHIMLQAKLATFREILTFLQEGIDVNEED